MDRPMPAEAPVITASLPRHFSMPLRTDNCETNRVHSQVKRRGDKNFYYDNILIELKIDLSLECLYVPIKYVVCKSLYVVALSLDELSLHCFCSLCFRHISKDDKFQHFKTILTAQELHLKPWSFLSPLFLLVFTQILWVHLKILSFSRENVVKSINTSL